MFEPNGHIHMWQSQVENEHYSYYFLTTFLTLHCSDSVNKQGIELKIDFQYLLSMY